MTTVVSASSKQKQKKKKANTKVWFWAAECKYEVILGNVRDLGWKTVEDERCESKVNLYWIDVAAIHERFRTIQPWQTINHFPGMPNIARKNRMGQNLNRMLKMFPREYAFYPRTWVLPGELADFRQQFDGQGNSIGNKIYIIKPDTGCQGRGIFLTRTFESVPQLENVVAQLYIKKPLLLDGFKFDLRIYCLVTSVKPLRVYLFQDGLVRMCTEEYVKPTKQNISNACMHLTNYAVNKHNSNFHQPSAKSTDDSQDSGSKRSVHWFMNWVRQERGDAKANWLWNRIGVLCVRTILAIIPTLSREYDQHFRSFSNIPFIAPQPSPNSMYGRASASSSSGKGGVSSGSAGGKAAAADDDDADSEDEDAEGSDDGDDDNNGAGRAPRRASTMPAVGGRKDAAAEAARKVVAGSSSASAGGGDSTGEGSDRGREGSDRGSGNKDEESGGSGADKKPQLRGSRCFEILGFDIMIDNNLKPWLIEVNHLPSFGTDSPLDMDIKTRLMFQTLRALSVLPDDEQAYIQFHKNEAEKRLTAKREREKEELHAQVNPRPKPIRRDFNANRPKGSRPQGTGAAGGAGGGGGALSEQEQQQEQEAAEQQLAQMQLDGDGVDASTAAAILAAMDFEGDDEEEDEEEEQTKPCTPERLKEIMELLIAIYRDHSPEKINKIDRLLQKYENREEEFLRFVHHKYSVPLPPSKKKQARIAAAIAAAQAAAAAAARATAQKVQLQSGDDGDNSGSERLLPAAAGAMANLSSSSSDRAGVGNSNGDHSRANSVSRNPAARPRPPTNGQPGHNRFARSLSPPPIPRRTGPSWKSAPEEDLAYRQDVLTVHVPKEEDEWMQLEMKHLTQFTRIFPPLPDIQGKNAAMEAEDLELEDVKEEDDNEDDDAAPAKNSTTTNDGNGSEKIGSTNKPTANGSAAAKIAPYDEIMFQVFLQDKRQTMRLRGPLGVARVRTANDADSSAASSSSGSLPPLDGSSNRPAVGTIAASVANKQGIGWRAPPRVVEKKEPLRMPTQTQQDAAKRLSQGLSVSAAAGGVNGSSRPRYQGFVPSVIVMDQGGADSLQMPMLPGQQLQQQQQQQFGPGQGAGFGLGGGFGPGGGPGMQQQMQDGMWSRRMNRLVEESRLARLRLETARNAPASVLRQQIFQFDPYTGQTTAVWSEEAAAGGGGVNTTGSGAVTPQPQVGGGLQQQQGAGGGGGGVQRSNSGQNPSPSPVFQGSGMAVVGGGGGGGSLLPAGAPGQIPQQGSGRHLPMSVGGVAGKTGSLSSAHFGVMSTSGSNSAGGGARPSLQQQQQQGGAGGGDGASAQHQEAILRQLFPGWF